MELVEYAGLEVTDFPMEVPIPEKPHLDARQNEEVKEWVLAVSMNLNLDQVWIFSIGGMSGYFTSGGRKGVRGVLFKKWVLR